MTDDVPQKPLSERVALLEAIQDRLVTHVESVQQLQKEFLLLMREVKGEIAELRRNRLT